jgi:hypothetical protein
VRASIWENKTEHGVRHKVNLTRLYKDGEEWKTTDSFGRDDLLTLAKALSRAHSWIFEQSTKVEPEA